jgi:Flp pilus assembly protein TadG
MSELESRSILCERGGALVEFALCLPMMMIAFAGIIDYGLYIQRAMQVTQAASAGATYGVIVGNQGNLTGMQTAAQNAASGLSGFSATATNVYTCSPGGTPVTSLTTCSGYGTPIKYVQVQANASFQPLVPMVGLPSPVTLQRKVLFRVPWTP